LFNAGQNENPDFAGPGNEKSPKRQNNQPHQAATDNEGARWMTIPIQKKAKT
jgi:hypothetical protein